LETETFKGVRRIVRRRYEGALSGSSVMQRIGHYQCRYEGQPVRSFLKLFAPWQKGGTAESGALLADYEKRLVYRIPEVLNCLEAYDTISFDLFDTLLFRDVEKPVDIFALVEQKTGATGFQSARIQAEQTARRGKYEAAGTWEVTFHEIYSALPKNIGGISRGVLAREELHLEREHCRVSPENWGLAEQLARMGRRVLILSDMYLSAGQLEELLSGYKFPGEICVSSEYGCSKADGRLFAKALSGSGKAIHVGDNFESDILMSRKAHIPALHYLPDIYPG